MPAEINPLVPVSLSGYRVLFRGHGYNLLPAAIWYSATLEVVERTQDVWAGLAAALLTSELAAFRATSPTDEDADAFLAEILSAPIRRHRRRTPTAWRADRARPRRRTI